MPKRIVVQLIAALLLCFAIGPHSNYQIRSCHFPNAPQFHELGPRFHRVFASVLAAYGMKPKDFALCNDSTDTMPGTGAVWAPEGKVMVVRLPRYTEVLSNLALRGLLAHEVGHVVVGFRPYSLDYEIQVDLLAAKKVGYAAMITCHNQMAAILEQVNPYMFEHNRTRETTAKRIEALLNERTRLSGL